MCHLFRGRVAASLTLLLACLPPPAAAQGAPDTAIAVGDIVVTGRTSPSSQLTSLDMLSGEVAQAQNVDSPWELFARLPGVVLTDFGQGTTSGRFSIRGFNGEGEINAVKLTIDGIPANDNAGRMDFIGLVQPLDIAAVTLVRGTADPHWGLHAIAGSADIATRSGGSYLDARVLAGAFGTRDAQLAAGVETGRLAQNLAVGYRRGGGWRDHADLDRLSVSGRWTFDAGPAQIGLVVRHAREEGEEPGYLTDADAYADLRRSYALSATDGGTRTLAQYALLLDAAPARGLTLSGRLYADRIDDDRYVRFSAAVAQQRRLMHEGQYGLVGRADWRVGDALTVAAGGDVQWQHNRSLRWTSIARRLTAATRDQAYELTVGGGYLQATLTPRSWLTVVPGWRFDRVGGHFANRLTGARSPVNDYGTIGQPKLSAALTPVAGVTAYANYGRSFQIGAGSGAYLVPPRVRDLAPSINTGWEAGVKLARGRWLTARAAAWQQVASGELRRRLDDPAGEFDNLGRTRRRGIDLEVSVRPVASLSAWVSWSHQRATIVVPDPATPDQAGHAIDHVPARVYTAGVEWTPGARRWRVSLWGNGQSAYELTTANDQGRYGDYVQLTAEIGWALTPHVELSAQARNLLNDRHEYVWYDGAQRLHAPADPRGAFTAVRLRL